MRLHHLGVVVPDLAAAIAHYRRTLQLEPQAPGIVRDPEQDADLVMLAPPAGGVGTELISPASPGSALHAQARRSGIAHSCYEVEDLQASVARLREAGALLVRAPCPAVLFGGRRIAFLYLKTAHLIELLEAP